MRVYEVTVIDKGAYPAWTNEVATYESYVAVFEDNKRAAEDVLPDGYEDEDIQYYFHEDEFMPEDGVVETEEFKYLIGKRVA